MTVIALRHEPTCAASYNEALAVLRREREELGRYVCDLAQQHSRVAGVIEYAARVGMTAALAALDQAGSAPRPAALAAARQAASVVVSAICACARDERFNLSPQADDTARPVARAGQTTGAVPHGR